MQCLSGREVSSSVLWKLIPAPIADQGFFQALCRIEAGGRQHLAEAAIKALNHAVGLRMAGLDQPVFDAVLITGAVAAMTSGRITLPGGATAIGECFAVIRQGNADLLLPHRSSVI